MPTYHVSVIKVHPDVVDAEGKPVIDKDGSTVVDMSKNCSKYVFGPKQCLTVGEANELLKAKKEEFLSTPNGKIQFSVTREHY